MNVQVSPGPQITNTLFSYFLLIITKQSLLYILHPHTFYLLSVAALETLICKQKPYICVH